MININYFYNARNYVEELHSALSSKEKRDLANYINERKLPSISEFLEQDSQTCFNYLYKTPNERKKIKKYNEEKNCYKHFLILFSFVFGVIGCINLKIISGLYSDAPYRDVFSQFSGLAFPSLDKEIVDLFFADYHEVEQYINDF